MEMRSSAFSVTVNGQPVGVAHAAASYDFVSFDITGSVEVAITAAEPGFWDKGVDIQPWRLGLRPIRQGQTIRFRLAAPAKLSISRPGDFLNYAKMLFLFAGSPPPPLPRRSNVRVCAAGRLSREPEPQERRDLLPRSRLLFLWQPESVEGARREDPGPGHNRLRGPAGSQLRRGLDAEARLALHRRARSAERGDRRAHLHRALAHLVDPDERFHGISSSTICA